MRQYLSGREFLLLVTARQCLMWNSNKVALRTGVARRIDIYVRGLGYLWDYQNPESLERATVMFKSAISMADKKFAQATPASGKRTGGNMRKQKICNGLLQAIDTCVKGDRTQ